MGSGAIKLCVHVLSFVQSLENVRVTPRIELFKTHLVRETRAAFARDTETFGTIPRCIADFMATPGIE